MDAGPLRGMKADLRADWGLLEGIEVVELGLVCGGVREICGLLGRVGLSSVDD